MTRVWHWPRPKKLEKICLKSKMTKHIFLRRSKYIEANVCNIWSLGSVWAKRKKLRTSATRLKIRSDSVYKLQEGLVLFEHQIKILIDILIENPRFFWFSQKLWTAVILFKLVRFQSFDMRWKAGILIRSFPGSLVSPAPIIISKKIIPWSRISSKSRYIHVHHPTLNPWPQRRNDGTFWHEPKTH